MKFCNWSSSNLDFPTSVYMALVWSWKKTILTSLDSTSTETQIWFCIHFFPGTDSRIFSNIKSFSKSYLLIWFNHFSRSNSEVGRPYLLPWLFNNFPSLLPSPKWHPLTRHDGMMIKVFSVFYFFREINFTKITSLITYFKINCRWCCHFCFLQWIIENQNF